MLYKNKQKHYLLDTFLLHEHSWFRGLVYKNREIKMHFELNREIKMPRLIAFPGNREIK